MPLEIEDVTLRFGGITALNNVNLTVSEKELLAIIGPNGAGKTALLNCISGVYVPTVGSINFEGHDLTTMAVHKIAAVGIGRSFQHAELFPQMTVSENLLLGRHLFMRTGIFSGALYLGKARREETEQREIIEGIVDLCELHRYRNAVVATLPYGVQKLVGVARALALKPKLLLLDEPSTGLVREERENFVRFLFRMRDELDLIIVWVEHDIQMVRDLSDRAVVFNHGEIIAVGSAEEICREPQVIEAYLGA